MSKRVAARLRRLLQWALAVGGLALAIWLLSAGPAMVALNRAGLASARAVKGTGSWAQAEAAWLSASQIPAARPAAWRGLAQVFWFWHRADELAARAAAQALAESPPQAAELSDGLAAAADTFRGYGALGTASFFYSSALSRADFSSPAVAQAAERHLALLGRPNGSNLVLSDNFQAGLTGWRAWGKPLPLAENHAAELRCGGCGLAQVVPALGAGVYRLSFEARAAGNSASLVTALTLLDDAPWRFDRTWSLTGEWQTLSVLVWLPAYGESAWELSFRSTGEPGATLRAVRLEKADAPDNRLLNPDFDFFDPLAQNPDDTFPPWKRAIFWNAAQAVGTWRAVPRPGGGGAMEVELMSALGPPEREGVQQTCGSAAAGAEVTLEADLNLPAELVGSVAAVQAVFYQSGEAGHYSVVAIKTSQKTDGWQRLTATGRVPDLPGRYACILTIDVVAQAPVDGPSAIAQFDSIALTVDEP